LEALGARVLPMQADVSDEEAMRQVMAEIGANAAPLRGIVHAAGVLADSTMQQMDEADFQRAFAPKARGAWVLHKLTQDLALDFFVLYSSVMALLGSPGQANYVAANAFLDALADYRRGQGMPALSINW